MMDSGWREESEKEEYGEELLFSASVIPVLKAVTLWEMPLLTGVRQEQGAPLVPGKAKYGQGAGHPLAPTRLFSLGPECFCTASNRK